MTENTLTASEMAELARLHAEMRTALRDLATTFGTFATTATYDDLADMRYVAGKLRNALAFLRYSTAQRKEGQDNA